MQIISYELSHLITLSISTLFLISLGCFTAVVPSVPFYLHFLGAPPSFLGMVVSSYSMGQIIGSPISGWLNDRFESRTLLTISSLVGLFASTIYAAAPNHWYVLISRLTTGLSAGMEFTSELAFIARNTTTEERTTYLASVTAVNVIGFILGPALTTVLSMLDFEFMGFKINEYTGPGWLLVMMFTTDVLMIRYFFQDSSPVVVEADIKSCRDDELTSRLLENGGEKKGVSYGSISKVDDNVGEMERGLTPVCTQQQQQGPPSLKLVILVLIFTQFTLMCAWSVLETITSPLAYDSFGWGVRSCNILFTCGGAASLLAYISFVVASKWIEDRYLIVYALIACFVGLVLMIHWSIPIVLPYKYCFLAGYLIMNAGFMTGRPVTFALYSKLVPPECQGKYLGWMVAGGSSARTLGPFVAVYLYYHIEGGWKNTLSLFGSEGVIMVICLVLVISIWPLLLPHAKPDVKTSSIKEDKQLLDKSSDVKSSHSATSATGDISLHVDETQLAQ